MQEYEDMDVFLFWWMVLLVICYVFLDDRK
jgi:hypothetical protein